MAADGARAAAHAALAAAFAGALLAASAYVDSSVPGGHTSSAIRKATDSVASGALVKTTLHRIRIGFRL